LMPALASVGGWGPVVCAARPIFCTCPTAVTSTATVAMSQPSDSLNVEFGHPTQPNPTQPNPIQPTIHNIPNEPTRTSLSGFRVRVYHRAEDRLKHAILGGDTVTLKLRRDESLARTIQLLARRFEVPDGGGAGEAGGGGHGRVENMPSNGFVNSTKTKHVRSGLWP
jgi:hypothetical protein